MSLRLLGDEMLAWSDNDLARGPGPVRGPALRPLLKAATARALAVGPHDPALLDAVPADELDLLVRGVPDAEALAARYADRPGVVVHCGSPERFAADARYDTVIALAGLDRLASAEGEQAPWDAALDWLLGALRPGGTVLLGVENLLGLHHLVALPPAETDADWAGGGYDPTRATGLAGVRGRLAAAGLHVTRTYAVYPTPEAPTAVLGADLLADGSVRGFLDATLSRACAPAAGALTDPARLASDALRHGLAAELAPAWILFARRPVPDNGSRGEAPVTLPDAVVATPAGCCEVRRDPAGRWSRIRDGAATAVPPGPTLAEVLIGASQRRELPAVRELLRAWQRGPAADVRADRVVAGPDGTLAGLEPPAEPGLALRHLAATLVRGGFAHPWPTSTQDELARILAAMAGREIGPVPPSLAEPGRPDAGSVRELYAERDRLAAELAAARAKARWYEENLTAAEDALSRAERIVELLSDSGPARAGKALMGGAKAARRSARDVVRRVRPPVGGSGS